jgi:hypothetical protein
MAQRIGPLDLNATKRLVNIFAIRAGAWTPPPVGPHASANRPPPMGHGLQSQFAPAATPLSAPPPPRHMAPGMAAPLLPGAMPGPPQTSPAFGPPRSYRPPFRNNETVFVGIPFAGDGFQLRRRLLGPQVSRVMNIINNIPGGNQNNIKIRLRGIGALFLFMQSS